MVVFGHKLLYSSKSICILAEVVFEQKWLYSGISCCIRAKVDVFGQKGGTLATVVVFF